MITLYYLQDNNNPQIKEVALCCKGQMGTDSDSLYFYSFGFNSPIYHEAPYSLAETLLSRYKILKQLTLSTKEESVNKEGLSTALVIACCKKYLNEVHDVNHAYRYEVQERSSKTYALGFIFLEAGLKSNIKIPLKLLSCQSIESFIEVLQELANKINPADNLDSSTSQTIGHSFPSF
jgi:hypothetical protein